MISILTPTYNRVHTLDRLWTSLIRQDTNHPFEWLLVDDGSIDETKNWFCQLKFDDALIAQYIYQDNQGKHVALNSGLKKVIGEWVLIVDSDDKLTPDAVQTIADDIKAVEADPQTLGLCYRKRYLSGDVVGRELDQGQSGFMMPNQAGALFAGDLAYVFRTSTLRDHPFPVFQGEKFVPELLIWNRIADAGSIYYFADKCIYECEYLLGGYSANFNEMLRCNPKGFGLFYRDQMSRHGFTLAGFKACIRFVRCWINQHSESSKRQL